MSESIAALIAQKKSCSHILHAILSVLTFGLWIIVWIAAGLTTAQHNRKIDDAITAMRYANRETTSNRPEEG